MWKKLEDDSNLMPQATSESVAEALMGVYRDNHSEKGKSTVGPQRVVAQIPTAGPEVSVAELQRPPMTTATMTTYTEAVNEFTKNATAFLGYLPLLTGARSAFEQAMRTSAELRKDLDSSDEKLQALMTQLEQMVKVQMINSAPDKKKPEPSKLEAIRGAEGSAGGLKTFP